MSTDATSPVGGEDTGTPTLEPEAEVETEGQNEPEQLFDEDGNPIAEPDEDEEVELDEDLKLKVPKDQAQKVREALLRQADYTRKTQSLADERKAFEAERANIVQATQEELAAFAQASTLGQRIAAYQKVDWNAWTQQAQAAFDYDEQAKIQAAWMDFQQLKDAHTGAMNNLSRLQQQRVSNVQQETAKRIEEGRAALVRENGWSEELKAKLTDYALSKGLSRDDLDDLEATPAAARILIDAFEGQQLRTKQQAAKRHEAAQQAQPAAKVGAKSAPPTGLDDRLSIEEWTKRRNKQLASRG